MFFLSLNEENFLLYPFNRLYSVSSLMFFWILESLMDSTLLLPPLILFWMITGLDSRGFSQTHPDCLVIVTSWHVLSKPLLSYKSKKAFFMSCRNDRMFQLIWISAIVLLRLQWLTSNTSSISTKTFKVFPKENWSNRGDQNETDPLNIRDGRQSLLCSTEVHNPKTVFFLNTLCTIFGFGIHSYASVDWTRYSLIIPIINPSLDLHSYLPNLKIPIPMNPKLL